MILPQEIKYKELLKSKIAPGKSNTSSKSNRTNKIAKKKKGALKVKAGLKASNPDSRGISNSFVQLSFSDIITCKINNSNNTRIITAERKIIKTFLGL